MFINRLKHTQRYQEIVNAFLRNGFSHILYRLGITSRKERKEPDTSITQLNEKHIGIKLRHTLQELGPTFIKLGQIASSRHDLVPEEIALELEKLQDHVQPVSFEMIKTIVERELHTTIEQSFQSFSEKPLATASIGQVHLAQLHTGEQVAVKVQRPDIQPIVETDLAILTDLAHLLEERFEWARTYQIQNMIAEFARSLHDELDYRIEGRNNERIALQFEQESSIRIPQIHWELSTKKVLTMTFIEGIKANDIQQLDQKGYNRQQIAQQIADSMLCQILQHGFFHGDPHPGNIFILPNHVIAYLDFGMVGQLNTELQSALILFILNVRKGDSKQIIQQFEDLDLLSEHTDLHSFQRDIEYFLSAYYNRSLQDIQVGLLLKELFQIAYHHHVRIPTDLTILAKTIITLEGLISKLDPQFSVMTAIEPFGKKILKERLHPRHMLQRNFQQWRETLEVLSNMPKELKALSTTIRKGKLQVDINVQQAQTFLRRLDQISNRLSFSIILLSFSILMVGLIIGAAITGQTNLLWRFPIIEAGSIIASLLFAYLIYSIFKSGRM